jgi:D-3-phosphoglycerate dehydrogenase
MKQQSLQKSKIKFLLLEGIHESAVDALGRAGYDNVVTYSKSLSTEELRKEIKDAHFVGIRSRTQLSEEVLEAAERLVAIGCFCIGTNQVDLTACGAQRCARF